MRRSEAVKILSNQIEAYLDYPPEHSLPYYLANRLLSTMENIGMMPPEIETKIWNRSDCSYYVTYEWEKE